MTGFNLKKYEIPVYSYNNISSSDCKLHKFMCLAESLLVNIYVKEGARYAR